MDQITLNLSKDSLLSLFMDFNLLTGIKIALFNEFGKEILAYPDSHCPFCAFIRSSMEGNHNCEKSNDNSFRRCQMTKKLEIYHCHAGLIETTAPLIDTGIVIGYIMFGQVTDEPDRKKVQAFLTEAASIYNKEHSDLNASIYNISYKSSEQILAAAKILETCTLYVLLNNMISLRRENFIRNLNQFLLTHLSEDLSVDRLTREFNISKNKLYDSCAKYMSTGIAEHIKNLRIKEAKRLLTETDLQIHQISDKVGFNDYNYFCRVFKKEVGIPAKKYRQLQR